MSCYKCHGEGEIVTCIDDMCRGLGECFHGDGVETCDVCDGDPYFGEEEDFDQAVRESALEEQP